MDLECIGPLSRLLAGNNRFFWDTVKLEHVGQILMQQKDKGKKEWTAAADLALW